MAKRSPKPAVAVLPEPEVSPKFSVETLLVRIRNEVTALEQMHNARRGTRVRKIAIDNIHANVDEVRALVNKRLRNI